MNLVIRKLGTHHFRIWVIYSIHACFGQGFLNVMSYLKIRLNSGMNRNSDRVSGSGLPNPELSKTPFRFRLNRSRILNVSGIRPDIPVPSRAQLNELNSAGPLGGLKVISALNASWSQMKVLLIWIMRHTFFSFSNNNQTISAFFKI